MGSSFFLGVFCSFINHKDVRGLLQAIKFGNKHCLYYKYFFQYKANCILAVYGLYRPQNNEVLVMARNEDTPGFIKMFFEQIELNRYVRKMLGIQDVVIQSEYLDFGLEVNQKNQFNQEDLKEIENSFKRTAQTDKEQINLLNTLPRRNIFIDRKLRYAKVGDKIYSYFFIITQIGKRRFQAEKRQNEFYSLQSKLADIFTPKNFPQLVLPKIGESVVESQQENQALAKVQNFECWLQKILQNPIFMIKETMDFLNSDEQSSRPFLTYFEFSYRSFCSKIYLINRLKNKKIRQQIQQNTTRKSLVGYYVDETDKSVSIGDYIKHKLNFNVTVRQTSQQEYAFEMMCTANGKQKFKWTVFKGEQAITELNKIIEEECSKAIPFYYQILVRIENKNHSEKGKHYGQYLLKLLQNKKYYCPSLFKFIRFDPINLKIISITAQQSSLNLFENERHSRYISQYEDKGNTIQVLRIDRQDENAGRQCENYLLKIRRNDLILRNKKTAELKALKDKLTAIYKNICNIPDLDLKNCKKEEIKAKVETFLLKVQNLPQIKINTHYCQFYEST